MERKTKSKPARKAAAKPAAGRKSVPPKASKAKTVAKKTAASQSGPAVKRSKPKNIFAKAKKTAKSKAKGKSAAAKSNRNSITQNVPLIEALDQALSGNRTEPAAVPGNGAPELAGYDQGRPPAWRPILSETSLDSTEAPARTNKLVPTNAVHTTKRRMKRTVWQSPILGLGAVAVVLAVLVLGNTSEPPDVSPLERRAEVQPSAPVPQAAKAPRAQNPNSPRGLKVLELVEMERMLARLEMDPSQPDGVVDRQTETAIRTYQQIAGLPVDGEATPELLDDMREVVKMMDGIN